MNLRDLYKKQLEYEKHFQYQLEHYTDLSEDLDNPNDSIKKFAKILFSKKKSVLGENLSGILISEDMDTADIFCMLIELVLYGLDILTNGETNIFDIPESTDDLFYTIKYYLKSTGFDMEVHEIYIGDDPTLYRDRTDYFCEILPKPFFLTPNGWYVLNYRIIYNKYFSPEDVTKLEHFKAFLITKNKQIFTICFKYLIRN